MVATQPPAIAVVTQAPASVAATSSSRRTWGTHTVRAGETLEQIAQRHRTTVATLAARNRLTNPHLILVGQRLSVPRTGSSAARATAPAAPAPARSRAHVVRSGETLSGIAERYRVPLASLLKANRLSVRTFIHPGQRLLVPSAGARVVKAAPATKAAKAKKPTMPSTFNGTRYPQSVVYSAARNQALLAARKVPSKAQVKTMIVETARRHGVDPKLALAIAYQESGWNMRAVSPANAVGVMQVIPAGGQWASELVGRRLNLLDARDNITAGVVMLRALGRSTDSTEMAVGAYYQGLYSVRTKGLFGETQRYVANVLALRTRM